MISPNPVLGTAIHAAGGISASTCYMPYEKVKKWSWGTFWLIQSLFAWLIMPLVIGYFTIPDLIDVVRLAPSGPFWGALILGAAYGFGGLSFGYAIRNIGYSLTYTISIGISAVLGTFVPLILSGAVVDHFIKPGGTIVLIGIIISMLGVTLCGMAGFLKEKDFKKIDYTSTNQSFNMAKGLSLALLGGVLSAVWGISLAIGQPISDIAAQHGAGHFEGNAKLIVSSFGCLITNLVWFTISTIKEGSFKYIYKVSAVGKKQYSTNFMLSGFAGVLWYLQFFFYGLAHVRMGNFKFASWVIHMSMLIFFSYIIGVIMKEWKGVSKKTNNTLIIALLILVLSFILMSYGSYYGEMHQ